MIISEPGERARHTSPTDANTHGPQRKKTQCCGEKKDTNTVTQLNKKTLAKKGTVLRRDQGHKHRDTATHKYVGKNKDTVLR